MTRTYILAVNKLVKIQKGRNAGKYKNKLLHKPFTGTWEEVEQYLDENNYVLVGFDFI